MLDNIDSSKKTCKKKSQPETHTHQVTNMHISIKFEGQNKLILRS